MEEFLTELSQSPFSLSMATSPWVVPTMQTVHILSLSILFISVLMVIMRVMGWAWSNQSVSATVSRFQPWAWIGFGCLAISGVVLIAAEPVRELLAISFWVKMALIVIAITISVRFVAHVRRNTAYWDGTSSASPGNRTFALITLAIWVAIIFLGRFIAYDTQIWGAWSPLYT